MAVAIDASALMVYRAAWTKDVQRVRVTREASMAKLFATESAQQVIDGAVQLFGGLGVVRGVTVERLYREIRALRIYEGASEVLELIIGVHARSKPRPGPRGFEMRRREPASCGADQAAAPAGRRRRLGAAGRWLHRPARPRPWPARWSSWRWCHVHRVDQRAQDRLGAGAR
jgi:hypothetical protein